MSFYIRTLIRLMGKKIFYLGTEKMHFFLSKYVEGLIASKLLDLRDKRYLIYTLTLLMKDYTFGNVINLKLLLERYLETACKNVLKGFKARTFFEESRNLYKKYKVNMPGKFSFLISH